jgi:hypothetical protein
MTAVFAPLFKFTPKGRQMAAPTLTLEGKSYDASALPDEARMQIANIQFCDDQIRQLRNEWAVADTARLGYSAALKRELS